MNDFAKSVTCETGLAGFADLADLSGFEYLAGAPTSPIGIFDSGFGGLTVAREIAKALPAESIIYIGDSARCPYGPREPSEVRDLVKRICTWLLARDVKMIVIACNTATAAGLQMAQSEFSVPVLGVIEPGARAAVRVTQNKKVGVIATKGTVNSGAYSNAIRAINPEITVFSTPTPRFVEIAEAGVKMAKGPIEDYTSLASKVYIRPEFQEIAREYLEPLRRCNIDTLVMGCTHFPLLKSLIGSVIGRDVRLINSACEVAQDVKRALHEYKLEACAQGDASKMNRTCARDAQGDAISQERETTQECKNMQHPAGIQKSTSENKPTYEFFTTGNDLHEFKKFGERVFRTPITNVSHADI